MQISAVRQHHSAKEQRAPAPFLNAELTEPSLDGRKFTAVWGEGDWIVRREIWRGKPWMGTVVRVIVDRPDLLVSYLPTAAPFGFPDGDWPGGRHPLHGRPA